MKKRRKKNLFIVILIAAAINMMTGCGSLKTASDDGSENTSAANVCVTDSDTYKSAYETLMEYKAEDYSRQSIAELSALIEDDYTKFSEAYNVVLQHILPDDENYDFVMLTLSASVAEIYYRNVEKSDVFSFGGCAKKLTQPVKPLPGEEEILAKNPVYDFLFFANYYINYTVPDSSILTVAERDNALAAVSAGMQKYVDGLSENEILSGDIETMLADKASALSESLSMDNIKLSCEISSIEIYNEGEQEIINLISKDDYQKLQLLQFDGYEDITVSDYQRKVWGLTDTAEYRDLLERVSGNEAFYELKDTDKTASFLFYVMEPLTAEKWETRNYSGYADSGFAYPEDNACDDFQVSLNDEELSFIKLTVFLSGMENGKMIQSIHTGRPAESPCYSEELPQKIFDEDSPYAAWCSLYYQFSYSISDKNTVTVGERDSQIQGMINAVRKFWNDSDIESVLKMNESDIVAELQRIAEAYSTGNIIITTNAEQVQFECMDERKSGL